VKVPKALSFLSVMLLAIASSAAQSADLSHGFFGRWFEAIGIGDDCSDDRSQIEIVPADGKIQVSSGSGDWMCTWSAGRTLSRISNQTNGAITVFSVKSQCERVDDRKYPVGASVITYVRRKHARAHPEELYIGSVNDAFQGLYHRCGD
jgi:hypothetical protein